MKNTVLQKFVSRKVNKIINENTNFGDIIDELVRVELTAKISSKLRPNTSLYIQNICIGKKKILYSLWANRKFVHLTAVQIFRLAELKERLSSEPEFDIHDTYTTTNTLCNLENK